MNIGFRDTYVRQRYFETTVMMFGRGCVSRLSPLANEIIINMTHKLQVIKK